MSGKTYGAVGVMMALKAGVLPETLSTVDVCVLLILADYAGEDGQAFPSTETVARVAHCGRRSVDRAIAVLIGTGILTNPVRRKYLPTKYSITLPAIEDRHVDDRQVDDRPSDDRQSGGRGSPHRRTRIATQADDPTPVSNSSNQLEGVASATEPPSGPRSGVKKTGATVRRAAGCPASTSTVTPNWLTKEQIPALESSDGAQVERFLDHHHAKGSLFKSWAAAWRTWTRMKGRDGSTLFTAGEGPAESVRIAKEQARREASRKAALEAKERLAGAATDAPFLVAHEGESEEQKAVRLEAFENMRRMFGISDKPTTKPPPWAPPQQPLSDGWETKVIDETFDVTKAKGWE